MRRLNLMCLSVVLIGCAGAPARSALGGAFGQPCTVLAPALSRATDRGERSVYDVLERECASFRVLNQEGRAMRVVTVSGQREQPVGSAVALRNIPLQTAERVRFLPEITEGSSLILVDIRRAVF